MTATWTRNSRTQEWQLLVCIGDASYSIGDEITVEALKRGQRPGEGKPVGAEVISKAFTARFGPNAGKPCVFARVTQRFEGSGGNGTRRSKVASEGHLHARHTGHHCECGNWSGPGSPCLYSYAEAKEEGEVHSLEWYRGGLRAW